MDCFHHQSIAASLGDLVGSRLEETLAGYLLMLLVLIPYFAFRVLDEALGQDRLVRMFFVEREPGKQFPILRKVGIPFTDLVGPTPQPSPFRHPWFYPAAPQRWRGTSEAIADDECSHWQELSS